MEFIREVNFSTFILNGKGAYQCAIAYKWIFIYCNSLIISMDKRVQIVLLGEMIWVIKFIVGGFIFATAGEGMLDTTSGVLWINGIEAFFVAIGLVLAIFLVYRDKGQNYKRTAWEAGISWYVILLLMDLIVLFGLFGLELELWFPLILLNFKVVIIPIVVGYLLAGPKIKV